MFLHEEGGVSCLSIHARGIYCTAGDGRYLLYCWGRQIFIVMLGTADIYCTAGDGRYLLYCWGRQIFIVLLGTASIYIKYKTHEN
jgi:hypothetical protein